jgi:hypothetical protein
MIRRQHPWTQRKITPVRMTGSYMRDKVLINAHIPQYDGVCEWRNTVEIIVSSKATDYQIIQLPCGCILSLGTNGRPSASRACSACYKFINPLGLFIVLAAVCDFPATFRYCYAVTVLEWNSAYIIVLSPVSKFESLGFHCYHRSTSEQLSPLLG